MSDELPPDEKKLRRKRINANVMMILGAIMCACALSAGIIALRPGAFPAWMTGRSRAPEPFRPQRPCLVRFAPLDADAFARAGAERRLVLLHLAPSWSREARVMEETTYADPAIAAWLEAGFVAARVDAEERPDLAERYGVGVWPSTVLLAPGGRPLAAAPRLTPKLLRPWADAIAGALRSDPTKEPLLAADVERRYAVVRARPDAAAGPQDPVWGGIHRSTEERAFVLADQAAAVAAGIPGVLDFVEKFLSMPGGGYAASAQGEAALGDGRIEEGFSYFAKDDAARRAVGLPGVDRRVFTAPNALMAAAVLRSRAATPAQKAHARRTVDFLWTRLVKNGKVCRSAGGVCGLAEDRDALAAALIATGRPDRAKQIAPRAASPAPTILKTK